MKRRQVLGLVLHSKNSYRRVSFFWFVFLDKQKNENPSISPLVIGEMFLNNKTDKDYGTKLANTIIAVELYYMILESATKE